MKKLIFLLILVMTLVEKEVKGIELFGCPTKETLKRGEFCVGIKFFNFILPYAIYTKIGVGSFMEIFGLFGFEGAYYIIKLKCLKEKLLPSVNFIISQGIATEGWLDLSHQIECYGLVFSKNFKPFKLYLGVINGKNPPLRNKEWENYYNVKGNWFIYVGFDQKFNKFKFFTEITKYNKDFIYAIGGSYKIQKLSFKLRGGLVLKDFFDFSQKEILGPLFIMEYKSEK